MTLHMPSPLSKLTHFTLSTCLESSLSLLEISEPEFWPLRMLYMFYLKLVIPLLGKLLLGNPENYRMLGRYTASFGNCTQMNRLLREAGFTVSYRRYFFGCATGIVATLPV